jgi:hypothetical protein
MRDTMTVVVRIPLNASYLAQRGRGAAFDGIENRICDALRWAPMVDGTGQILVEAVEEETLNEDRVTTHGQRAERTS